MEDQPKSLVPRGRGKQLLEALKRSREMQKPGGEGASAQPVEPPKPRGRAALLNKMKELRLGPSTAVPEPAPILADTPVKEPEQQVESEPCTFQGTGGQPVHVTANYIRLNIEKGKGIFEYELRFNPTVDAEYARIKIVVANLEALGGVRMYDGGSCIYLPIRLPQEIMTFQTKHPIDGNMIEMSVIFKKQKKFGECLHHLNVLFKRVMGALNLKRIRRNFFDPPNAKLIPQHRLEVLPGYVVAVDEFEGGLMLCLDTQHKVIRTETVLEYLNDLRRGGPEHYRDRARDALLGAVVITKYNNMTHAIDEIIWDGSPTDTFETHKGDKISFIDYYKNAYGVQIMDRSQPLLLHRLKRKVSMQAKEEDQNICLIPELCYLTGLTDQMRADFRVMKEVAAFTRVSPHQRLNSLRTYLNNVRNSPKAQEILGQWGVRIEDATIDLNARILSPEMIIFGGGQSAMSNMKADWTRAAGLNRVVGPVDIMSWVVIHVQKDARVAEEFGSNMSRLSKTIGFRITPPRLVAIKNDRTNSYVEALGNVINDNVQCVVMICPTARDDLYSVIKKITCVQSPVGSQVIQTRTLLNPSKVRTITLKIALQINCKLGGSLWAVKIPVKTWMVCGIDVYHSPGSKKSVAALVSSMNENMTSYYTSVVQEEKELSDCMRMPFMRSLMKFKEKRGIFPSVVVIYRDGVGDGQLDHVKRFELRQFQEVVNQLQIDLQICLVVIQKRINTRLVIKNEMMENPPPGTIVDHTITRRYYQDFFLVPQNVTQGTVAPTHYIILHNGANIKADHLQKLSFKMCHLYYNWSGTIRVPAPCQYAHKVAQLVGQHIQKLPAEVLADKLYYL